MYDHITHHINPAIMFMSDHIQGAYELVIVYTNRVEAILSRRSIALTKPIEYLQICLKGTTTGTQVEDQADNPI